MTYAFRIREFSGRTRAAASVSKPVLVFRTRKRERVCRHLAGQQVTSRTTLSMAGPEVMSMEAFQEMFCAYTARNS